MSTFRCPYPDCGKTFDTDRALQGHRGGAHARRRQTRSPIRHGTAAGYRSHKRQGQKACVHCLRAWAAKQRASRRDKERAAKRAAK